MNVHLNYNLGFSWFKNDALFFKGYFYIDAIFYEKENAFNYLLNLGTTSKVKAILPKINGVFSIIYIDENNVFVASDITRSFPIFYTKQHDSFFLSDDILFLKNKFTIDEFDALAEIEFKASNHTHGKKTLLKNVFQVQASEYLIFKNDTIIEQNFFFSYAIEKEENDNFINLKKNTILAFENAFKRCLNSIENRTIVVPLSAGFDSRLIAVMLKKYHFKNVVCFTYGKKDSLEIANSKKVSKTLGLTWHFIEYSANLTENFIHKKEFKDYVNFAGKLSSMPNLQEYFAVKYLKENKLIPANAVFISGYAGDLLGGSQFLKVIPENLQHKELVDLIVDKKFTNYSFINSDKKILKKNVAKQLLIFDKNYTTKIPSSVFEDYDLKEKIAKYIFNSANFYTFFGFEYRFPFWDTELLAFFKKLPVKHKLNKTLFDAVLIENYFKPFQVCFETEIQPTEKMLKTQKIKNKIKPFLPTFIKKKKLLKNDWNNYQPITAQMEEFLASKKIKVAKLYLDYNEIITQWYVYISKNKTL